MTFVRGFKRCLKPKQNSRRHQISAGRLNHEKNDRCTGYSIGNDSRHTAMQPEIDISLCAAASPFSRRYRDIPEGCIRAVYSLRT